MLISIPKQVVINVLIVSSFTFLILYSIILQVYCNVTVVRNLKNQAKINFLNFLVNGFY